MRATEMTRQTTEVTISLHLNLDGTGEGRIDTGIKFFDHLLLSLSKHSLFNLEVLATGDLHHHIVEDVALTLGKALDTLLGEKKGLKRFASVYVPMDEALARAAIDLSGRPYFNLQLNLLQQQIEDMQVEDIIHFFESLALASKITLHLAVLYGQNEHHKIEAGVKALALAFREASRFEPRLTNQIPSAKGVL